jgi:hypothetical protein
MQKNPPNCGEEKQVFGKPCVGVKIKQMRNCEYLKAKALVFSE